MSVDRSEENGEQAPGMLPVPERELLSDRLLASRAVKSRDPMGEIAALHDIATTMVQRPNGLYQSIVDLSLELCAAGSAGISLLEQDARGSEIFRWIALAGAFRPHIGSDTPRDFSSCGMCLARSRAILLRRPARRFRYFDGVSPPIIEELLVPLYGQGGQRLGTIWVAAHDQTTRFDKGDAGRLVRLASFASLEIQKVNLLREKELLLRELQHRSSNNLMMILNLLAIQEKREKNQRTRHTIGAMRGRVAAIIRVTEELSRKDRPNKAAVSDLLQEICDGFSRLLDKASVELNLKVEPVELGGHHLLPMALIVNELVTNSLKHAFPSGRKGRIEVTVHRQNDAIALRVADDGVAFPDDVLSASRSGLGLSLVRSFVRQLGAKLDIDHGAIKEFVVTIPA